MAAQPISPLSVAEYLEIERASETKHEYFCGRMYDMAGGSYAQAIIAANLITEINLRVRSRGCRAASGDLRVQTAPNGLLTYPDVTVVCGESVFADERRDTLVNPTVLVEVLSKSTEAHDRGFKFSEYRRIESLRGYILVSQSEPRVEVFSRAPENKRVLSEFAGIDAECEFPDLDCKIPLAGIYEGVAFERA